MNDIIPNVFKKFVPNKFITCDDRDPSWINDKKKTKSNGKILCTKIIREMAKKLRNMSY